MMLPDHTTACYNIELILLAIDYLALSYYMFTISMSSNPPLQPGKYISPIMFKYNTLWPSLIKYIVIHGRIYIKVFHSLVVIVLRDVALE